MKLPWPFTRRSKEKEEAERMRRQLAVERKERTDIDRSLELIQRRMDVMRGKPH